MKKITQYYTEGELPALILANDPTLHTVCQLIVDDVTLSDEDILKVKNKEI